MSDRSAIFIRLILAIILPQRLLYYYTAGDRGAPLLFNGGDEFSVRKVLVALDQSGRGKGDLIGSSETRRWPNQQREPLFSWNNKNADTGQVLGFIPQFQLRLKTLITIISVMGCRSIKFLRK